MVPLHGFINLHKIYYTTLLGILIFLLFPIRNGSASELSKEEQAYLQEKETIVFVSQTRYPPFEFVDKSGQHTGMCIELARWISTELGFTAKFVDTSFQDAQQAILSNKADVLTSFFYSKKRDELFDFTQVMFEVPASIFVLAQRTDIKGIDDLNGKIISMQAGDYAKEYLESKNISFDVVYTKDFADATDLVIAGKADAVIGDEQIVLYHIFKNRLREKIKKVGDPLYIGQNCMAIKGSNRTLLNILNKGITLARKKGIFEKINRKWIGTHYTLRESLLFSYFNYIIIFVGAVFMLLLLVWFWNIRLRHVVSKRTEELEKSEQRYRNLFEGSRDAIYMNDSSGKFLDVNQSMLDLFGYTKDEMLGMSSVDTYAEPADRLKLIKELNKGSVVDYEIKLKKKDGKGMDCLLTATARHGDEGSIVGYEGIIRDITEKRKLEAQLQRAKKMEALGLLAGGVAHDLNNILSGIVSYPELLLMDLPQESPLRKPIKIIQESGMRAADVVADLLTIARGVAAGKEILNLNALIKEYLNSPEHKKLEMVRPSVTFKTELDPDLLNINCSPTHMKKTLMNLVINASEAIDGTGTVTIKTVNRYLDEPLRGYEDVNRGEYAVLIISDDGCGISPEDLERIFEPFYSKKVMGRSGTGLGLAVVWNTIQEHDGYINVRSSDKGTIFELYLPVTREEVTTEKEQAPLDDYLGHGEKILVVDDEEGQREIACGMLTRLGYNAEAVSSGEMAIEYLKERSIDLVILDMIMPKGINGRETYEEIIKIHPEQKAIIASGFSETEDVKIVQRLGAGKYIKKPYTLAKIGLAVKEELKK